MSLVDVATVKAFAPTDLSDSQVQLVIDEAEAAIVQRHGANAGSTVTEQLFGGNRLVLLARPASAITSVVEYRYTTPQTLVADTDYRFVAPLTLERYGVWWGVRGYTGTLVWGHTVTITYTPVDDSPQRKLAIVNLCRLAFAYSGYKSLSLSGVTTEVPLDYQQERERIIAAAAARKMQFV